MEINCAKLCKNGDILCKNGDMLCKAVQEWRSTVQSCAGMEIFFARMEICCARLCKNVDQLCKAVHAIYSTDKKGNDCARLCKAVHGCARMEMGVVHDVIDCYDITEVSVMSFEWFLL